MSLMRIPDVREPDGEAEGVSATEEDDEGAAEGSGRGVRRIRQTASMAMVGALPERFETVDSGKLLRNRDGPPVSGLLVYPPDVVTFKSAGDN